MRPAWHRSRPWRERDGSFSPLRLAALLALTAPGLWLAFLQIADETGLRALRTMLFESGLWSGRLLLASLAMGPLSRIAHWPRLIALRRMVGLSAFAYAAIHFWAYAIGQSWQWGEILHAILRYRYLTIGTAALLVMVVLAMTSNDLALHRLGGPLWRGLHRLAFGAAALVVAHFLLANRARAGEAIILAGLLAWLLIYRQLTRGAGHPPRPWALLLLAVASAVLTAAGEFAWYALATGIDPFKVLAANLTLVAGLRPAWWVLLIGLAVVAGAALRRRVNRSPAP